MKQIVDQNNIPIQNTFRSSDGGIVIDDQAALEKFKRERQRAERIQAAGEKVSELENKIQGISCKLDELSSSISILSNMMSKIVQVKNESAE